MVLAKGMESVDYTAFTGDSKISEIYCYATEPPSVTDLFTSINGDACTLYAPSSSWFKYATHAVWSMFDFSPMPGLADAIVITENEHGTLSVAGTDFDEVYETEEGATYEVTITPDFGYEIDKVTIDGEDVTSQVSDGKIEVTGKNSDQLIQVTYVKIENVTVIINESENGIVTANTATPGKGETVSLTISPDDGYKLASLTVSDENGVGIVVDKDNTFTMPEGSVTITATFEEADESSVTLTPTTGGTVSVDKPVAKPGETVTITASPDTGKEVDAITVTDKDGNSVPVSDDNSFTMPEGGATVTVTFKDKEETFDIVIASVPHGRVVCDIAKALPGTNVSLTATPDANYHLDKITVLDAHGVALPVSADGTFLMPHSAVTIRGRFVMDGAAHFWNCQ